MSDVTPGVLDAGAERAFSFGACAGLAIAIHDDTGWPLVKVTDAHAVYAPNGTPYTELDDEARETIGAAGMGAGGIHWLVQHPDGRLIDVDGAHTAADVLAQWDGDGDEEAQGRVGLGVAARDDAIDEYVIAKGEPVALTVCATFVAIVLERAGAAAA